MKLSPQEIEATYNKWWKGKKVRIHQSKIITVRQVTYYGNSVYGGASLIDENNDNFPIFTRSYRPRKKDVEVIE